MTQASLFDTFRVSDPPTSMQGPRNGGRTTFAEMVDVLERSGRGMTADELAAQLPHRVRSTVAGLCSRRLVPTGDQRPSKAGVLETVWGLP